MSLNKADRWKGWSKDHIFPDKIFPSGVVFNVQHDKGERSKTIPKGLNYIVSTILDGHSDAHIITNTQLNRNDRIHEVGRPGEAIFQLALNCKKKLVFIYKPETFQPFEEGKALERLVIKFGGCVIIEGDSSRSDYTYHCEEEENGRVRLYITVGNEKVSYKDLINPSRIRGYYIFSMSGVRQYGFNRIESAQDYFSCFEALEEVSDSKQPYKALKSYYNRINEKVKISKEMKRKEKEEREKILREQRLQEIERRKAIKREVQRQVLLQKKQKEYNQKAKDRQDELDRIDKIKLQEDLQDMISERDRLLEENAHIRNEKENIIHNAKMLHVEMEKRISRLENDILNPDMKTIVFGFLNARKNLHGRYIRKIAELLNIDKSLIYKYKKLYEENRIHSEINISEFLNQIPTREEIPKEKLEDEEEIETWEEEEITPEDIVSIDPDNWSCEDTRELEELNYLMDELERQARA